MIYLLGVKRGFGGGYDSYYSKVVRAASEEIARKLANESTGCEGEIWMDSEKVSCEALDVNGPAEVICSDFNAG